MAFRFGLGLWAAGGGLLRAGPAVPQRVPLHQSEHVLVSSAGWTDWRYLAFPALLDLGDDVLVSYKRARTHGDDPGATLEAFRIDGQSGRVSDRRVIAAIEGKIMQMGEWVRFPNGHIANYIDAQQKVTGRDRIGLRVVWSTDGGRTFGPVERVGLIDGVEYGYAFEAVTAGRTTWMLAMTFSYLTGGKSVYAGRPAAGSVDIIRSEDNGRTWRFVRSLTQEFGNIPINESTFIRHGAGFVVSTRGYDNRQRLHVTDGDFKVLRQVDLTAKYPFIASYVGRPRLFTRDGNMYLLGRNWTKLLPPPNSRPSPGAPAIRSPEQLCLFRLDPGAPAVTAYAILDNAGDANVTDGYYAMPYFREIDGRTHAHVVTYKGLDGAPPQIVRLEYLWDEIK